MALHCSHNSKCRNFLLRSYLDDVHKSTTLSLDDLAEFEKSLDQTKKNEEKNSSQSLNLGKQTTWVEQSLELTTADPSALNYHSSAIEGDVFLQVLVSKLNENPNAKASSSVHFSVTIYLVITKKTY